MSRHLYRVTIESYPTPDGKPFVDQPVKFWQDCLDAHYNTDAEPPLPAFMDWDFEEWIFQEDYSGYGGEGATYYSGPGGQHISTDPAMCVPVSRRRHWQSASSARREAKKLREWGCIVKIDKSKPIEWETTDD